MRTFAKLALLFMLTLTLSACNQGVPPDALKLTDQSLQDRQLETRRFDTRNEKKLLIASAQVLQDLGFTIDESATKLGVIAASKQASAVNGGQIAAAVFVAVLGGGAMPIDDKQKIRVSVVSRPAGKSSTALRVTFQRIVWNNQGAISHIEFVGDKEIYQDFFVKLSKSVFLTANDL